MSETPSYAELLAENQALKQQLAVLPEELTDGLTESMRKRLHRSNSGV